MKVFDRTLFGLSLSKQDRESVRDLRLAVIEGCLG